MAALTVEKLAKELMKQPNQQLQVYFKSGKELVPAGTIIPIHEVTRENVLTLDGQHQAIMLTGKVK